MMVRRELKMSRRRDGTRGAEKRDPVIRQLANEYEVIVLNELDIPLLWCCCGVVVVLLWCCLHDFSCERREVYQDPEAQAGRIFLPTIHCLTLILFDRERIEVSPTCFNNY